MNDTDARQLIQRYATSYFVEDSAEGWFRAAENGRSVSSRAIGGSKVPILRGKDLTAAMIENTGESRLAVRDCGDRLKRARLDGLLDMEAYSSLSSKKTKAAWLAAVQVVRGDYHRAVSEMKQWQEYAELASAGELPTLAAPTGVHALIKQLADAKSYAPDPRLPPEHDDEEIAS